MGRPPGGKLNAPKITAAALALIYDSGYQGLTMAALARNLNVSVSALYNHVTCKQDVLRLLEEHLIVQVKVSAFRSSNWEDAIYCWARSYRDAFAKHTPLIPVIAVLPVMGAPKTLAMYEEVTTGLLKAGFREDRIIPIIAAIEAFIFGAALDVNAPEGIFNPGTLAHQAPTFTAVQAYHESGRTTEQRSDAAFRLGLEALIKGLGAFRL
ncbi:TetR/AcrR family transcriptional regulator [Arthrobacter sp. NPDC080031]|uniref:TetR/AcrR family transcriptional regulator n=1 Tax=Arthrobacter sp. NPDC080031 TaxID=3155918 RepID=UPI00344E8F7A